MYVTENISVESMCNILNVSKMNTVIKETLYQSDKKPRYVAKYFN